MSKNNQPKKKSNKDNVRKFPNTRIEHQATTQDLSDPDVLMDSINAMADKLECNVDQIQVSGAVLVQVCQSMNNRIKALEEKMQ